MTYFWKISLILLMGGYAWSSPVAILIERCMAVDQLAFVGTREIKPDQLLLESERVLPAFKLALSHYHEAGIEPPQAKKMLPTDSEFDKEWVELFLMSPNIPNVRVVLPNIPMHKMIEGSDPVYRVVSEGKAYAFREADTYTDIRLVWAASKMNEFMGLDTVPQVQVGRVKGKIGVLSDFISGRPLPNLEYQAEIKELLKSGALDERSYSNAKGFEFIVGNNDAGSKDVLIELSGKVKVLDHNYTAAKLVPEYFAGEESAVGTVLPDKYTPEFIKMIDLIDRDGMKRTGFLRLMQMHYTAAEIEAILFRVDIIVADMARRGSSARFE